MTGVLYAPSQATLVTTALICSVLTAKTLATLPRTVQIRSPLQEHHFTKRGHAPNPVGTDPSCLNTDTAKEAALTGHDHSANATMAEAPATIGGTHPTPHPTNIAAYNTHQLTDALGNTLTGTQHTGTTVTHLRHATSPARVTLKKILWTEANLVKDILQILPTDLPCGRHQSHILKQQPLINLTARRRSPFRIHNWTLHHNQIIGDPSNF